MIAAAVLGSLCPVYLMSTTPACSLFYHLTRTEAFLPFKHCTSAFPSSWLSKNAKIDCCNYRVLNTDLTTREYFSSTKY